MAYFYDTLILPRNLHLSKFCTAVEIVDIISCDNFFGDRLRDVDSVRVENRKFPLTKLLAVNTANTTAQRAEHLASKF